MRLFLIFQGPPYAWAKKLVQRKGGELCLQITHARAPEVNDKFGYFFTLTLMVRIITAEITLWECRNRVPCKEGIYLCSFSMKVEVIALVNLRIAPPRRDMKK